MCPKLYGVFKVSGSYQFEVLGYDFKRNTRLFFTEKRKPDIYREGYWMHLSKLKLALYPITLFRKYTEVAKIKESEEKFIFRQISYTRDILLTNLKNIGLDKTQSGFHNLRSGGKTTGVSFGINDRLFLKHGRWKLENVKKRIRSRKFRNPTKYFQNLSSLNLSPYS